MKELVAAELARVHAHHLDVDVVGRVGGVRLVLRYHLHIPAHAVRCLGEAERLVHAQRRLVGIGGLDQLVVRVVLEQATLERRRRRRGFVEQRAQLELADHLALGLLKRQVLVHADRLLLERRHLVTTTTTTTTTSSVVSARWCGRERGERGPRHDALDLARVLHVLLASLGLDLLTPLVVQQVAQVGVELLDAHKGLVALAANLTIEEHVGGGRAVRGARSAVRLVDLGLVESHDALVVERVPLAGLEALDVGVVVAARRAPAVYHDREELVVVDRVVHILFNVIVIAISSIVSVHLSIDMLLDLVVSVETGGREELRAAPVATSLARQVLLDVERLGKRDAVADLEARHGRVVEVEAIELQRDDVGKRLELEALVSATHALAAIAVVGVRLVQRLGLNVGVESRLHALVRLVRAEGSYAQRDVEEDADARILLVALEALDVVLDLALIELVDEVGLLGVLEVLLERVEHDAAQLLHVVLLEGVVRRPAERARQVRRLDGALRRRLQVEEQALQLERYAPRSLVVVVLAACCCCCCCLTT